MLVTQVQGSEVVSQCHIPSKPWSWHYFIELNIKLSPLKACQIYDECLEAQSCTSDT